MLTPEQFERTRRLALSLAGIELVERHRQLLTHRRRRLGIGAETEWDALLGAAEAGSAAATRQVISLVTTNFTGFFRHPRHFKLAAEHTLRAVQRRGQARLWSAATATGEEAYSLAILLKETFQRENEPVSILATDIDAEALEVARRGQYGERQLHSVSPRLRARHFHETGSKCWTVVPAVRHRVEFRALNLTNATWPVEGPFDVIFCRNVLMYLEVRHRATILQRMLSLLMPEGVLILDPTEHLGEVAPWFVPQADGVYSPRHVPSRNFDGERRLV